MIVSFGLGGMICGCVNVLRGGELHLEDSFCCVGLFVPVFP